MLAQGIPLHCSVKNTCGSPAAGKETLQCHQDHGPDLFALSGGRSGQAVQAGSGGLHSQVWFGATGV